MQKKHPSVMIFVRIVLGTAVGIGLGYLFFALGLLQTQSVTRQSRSGIHASNPYTTITVSSGTQSIQFWQITPVGFDPTIPIPPVQTGYIQSHIAIYGIHLAGSGWNHVDTDPDGIATFTSSNNSRIRVNLRTDMIVDGTLLFVDIPQKPSRFPHS